MKTNNRLPFVLLGLALTIGPVGRLSAADEPNAELIQMIVSLVTDQDRDMRAVGLQQVREEVKGPEATRQFAALLPKLSPEAQAGLIDALADRGDNTARPAVLEMLGAKDEPVRAAAIRALGPLGKTDDVPLLVKIVVGAAGANQATARASLVRLAGDSVDAAIVAHLKAANADGRVELLGVLASRRAFDTVPAVLETMDDADAKVRMAAMGFLGQLAGPEHVAGMLQGVLKAKTASERDAAEKAVLFVCNRIDDPNRRADPLLTAMDTLADNDKMTLLPTLGRVGGPAASKPIEAAIADSDPQCRDVGLRALCNWPDASMAPRLLELTEKAGDVDQRALTLKAFTRVVSLPDKRSDAERLEGLKKAMVLATTDEERNFVLKRAKAIRTIDSLHFVLPYLEKSELAQETCVTIVELAHHRKLREPNKAEFDKALDAVIGIGKDADVVKRAKLYKAGKTL
jgi:hypothetical protein